MEDISEDNDNTHRGQVYEEDETVITTTKRKPVEKIMKKVVEIVMTKMTH